jgi:hypothetical protein
MMRQIRCRTMPVTDAREAPIKSGRSVGVPPVGGLAGTVGNVSV